MSEQLALDPDDLLKTATISPDGMYRYALTRRWSRVSTMVFVMLNPSTADASIDDPTIRRCMGFARRRGFGGVKVVNLYAYRATDPKDLWRAQAEGVDIVGPYNAAELSGVFSQAMQTGDLVVAAWGAGAPEERAREVNAMTARVALPVLCLGVTKSGAPRHPLYVKGDTTLKPWSFHARRFR